MGFEVNLHSPLITYEADTWCKQPSIRLICYSASMNVKELTSKYRPVYPETHEWADTLKLLETDPVERNIMQDLISEYMRDGKFRDPVMVSEPDETDDYGYPFPYVSDGTHRVCVALKLGLKTLDTCDADTQDDESAEDTEEEFFTETVVIIPEPEIDEVGKVSENWEAKLNIVFDVLRSVKLTDQIWLTALVAFSTSNKITITWDHLIPETMHELVSETASDLVRMFAREQFPITVTTSNVPVEDEDN